MCEIMLYVSENICESTGIKETTSCENTAGFLWREKKKSISIQCVRVGIKLYVFLFSIFGHLLLFSLLLLCALLHVGFAFRLNPLSTNLHKDILHRSRPFLALSRQILQINRRKTNTLFRKMEFTPKNRSRNPRILISGVGRVVPLFAASVSCSGC